MSGSNDQGMHQKKQGLLSLTMIMDSGANLNLFKNPDLLDNIIANTGRIFTLAESTFFFSNEKKKKKHSNWSFPPTIHIKNAQMRIF